MAQFFNQATNIQTANGLKMLVAENDEITAAVEALVAMSAAYNRGQVIGWDSVEATTGPRYQGRAGYVIKKWRKRLQNDREIVTLCAESVGVRLLTHQQVAEEIPMLAQRRNYRMIRRSRKKLACINTGRLSLTEQRLLAAQTANLADQQRELHRSIQQLAQRRVPADSRTPYRKPPELESAAAN